MSPVNINLSSVMADGSGHPVARMIATTTLSAASDIWQKAGGDFNGFKNFITLPRLHRDSMAKGFMVFMPLPAFDRVQLLLGPNGYTIAKATIIQGNA